MGLFSGKAKRDFNDKEREKILRELQHDTRNFSLSHIYAGLGRLVSGDHLKATEVPFVVSGVIEAVSRKNLDEGLGIAIWSMTSMDNPDLRAMLADKTFSMIAQADKKNMKQMATVAMAANALASLAVPDSETKKRAQREWLSAVDTLAAKKEGLSYAFAAASNAAVGTGDMPLRKDAIDKWEEIVSRVAQDDKATATAEAKRVTYGYQDFGQGAYDFRVRAANVWRKLIP